MDQIVAFVQDLIVKGKAYEVEGDVYYDVHASRVRKSSHINLEDLEAGARIEVDSRRKNLADFALWKKSKDGEPSALAVG